MKTRLMAGMFMLLLALTAAGCGGGGGGSTAGQPTKAIVRVATSGTLASGTLIGGIAATVNYAGGKGLSILPGSITLSGVGSGSTLVPNTNAPGQVVLGLINASGVPLGEFATLSFDIAPGNFPSASDFSIAPGSSAVDVSSAGIAGVSTVIAGVTIQ